MLHFPERLNTAEFTLTGNETVSLEWIVVSDDIKNIITSDLIPPSEFQSAGKCLESVYFLTPPPQKKNLKKTSACSKCRKYIKYPSPYTCIFEND